jgi:hypothetical protein
MRARPKLPARPRHRLAFPADLARRLAVALIQAIDDHFDRPAPPVIASIQAISEESQAMPDGTRAKFNRVRVTLKDLPPDHDVISRVIVPVIDGVEGDKTVVAPDSGPTMILVPQGATYKIRAYDNDGTSDGPATESAEKTAVDEWPPAAPGEFGVETVDEVFEDGTPVAGGGTTTDGGTTAGGGTTTTPTPTPTPAPEPAPEPLPPLGETGTPPP